MIAGLPYDAEVEYLESTGTQYIDLSQYFSGKSLGISIKWCPVSTTNDRFIFGGGQNSTPQYFRFGVYGSNNPFVTPSGGTCNILIQNVNNMHIAEMVDGQYVITESDVDVSDDHVFLFCQEWGGQPAGKIEARLFHVQFYLDGQLFGDFIPVRVGSGASAVGCMYDRVSRKLFRNAGTGAFTIGPDVATPVMGLHFFKSQIKTAKDYVQNGLIAMWDGIENAGWGTHDQNITTWADLTGRGAGWMLKGNWTPEVFEVGSDYVKILSDVSYNGRGHCTPSWSSGNDIITIEIVLDNTDFDIISDTMARLVSFGVGSGNFDQTIHVKGTLLAPSIYNKYGQVSLVTGTNAISLVIGSQPVLLNGLFVQSVNRTFSGYTYYAPVLGAYAATAAIGVKVKSMRIYGRSLTDAERLANYAVDKRRFNLQ